MHRASALALIGLAVAATMGGGPGTGITWKSVPRIRDTVTYVVPGDPTTVASYWTSQRMEGAQPG